MKHINRYILLAALLLLAVSCKNGAVKKPDAAHAVTGEKPGLVTPRHARGFNVSYTDAGVLVDIQDPLREASESFHFLLVPRGSKPGLVPSG